ncbi:UNVERIFIED_ORG: hypothetical protein ABIC54_001620 [Burkholderia sp. 1263]
MLNTNRNILSSIGSLIGDTLGTVTQFTGLGCVPSIPAALTVVINPGVAYSLQNLDNTPYSSLAQDTAHQIMKQGIMQNAQTLSTPAPATSGYSVNYLVSASFVEADINPVVLPYYNAANPQQAFSGPSGNGTANNTTRQNTVLLTITPGVAALTGSQVTPPTPTGTTALYVVTVAFGQTTVTAGNITKVSGAPFFPGFLKADGSVPLTAVQTGATAAQFDNSTKLATMAALQRQGIQASGIIAPSTSQALTPAIAGGTVLAFSVSPITLTLPAVSSFPVGGRIEFLNISAGSATIARTGSDTIALNSTGGATSVVLNNGDSLTLEASATGQWYAVGGSAQLGFSTAFNASLSANGYQKLPSGLIIQWGTTNITATTAGYSTDVTLPIAFITAGFSAYVTYTGNAPPTNSNSLAAYCPSLSIVRLTAVSSSTSSPGVSWFAIGK